MVGVLGISPILVKFVKIEDPSIKVFEFDLDRLYSLELLYLFSNLKF